MSLENVPLQLLGRPDDIQDFSGRRGVGDQAPALDMGVLFADQPGLIGPGTAGPFSRQPLDVPGPSDIVVPEGGKNTAAQ